jgi:plastocyanin
VRRAASVRALTAVAGPLAALAAVTPVPASGDGPLDVRPTPVGVAEREFRITPYRRAVKPGPVKLNVKNLGEDVHDLVVITPKGRKIADSGEIRAGEGAVVHVRLKHPGTYRLVCTQGDHSRRGMKTRLVVRR